MSFFPPTFPPHWTRLRDQGRLQFCRMQRSGRWYAAIPELGAETYARELRELKEWVAARIDKLPPVVEPQRVNGVPWPEPMPASKNLLPRR